MGERARAVARSIHMAAAAAVAALHRPRRRQADPFHVVGREFDELVGTMDRPRVLEVGSRNVTGISRRHLYPNAGQSIGFDIHPGPGVDVVGDAHRLGDHFPPGHFDAVFAASVFEHLLFPWKVVLELNKVMRVGGVLLVTTHPLWPAHELPWDFWRFPAGAFTALFNRHTGFEVRRCQEGLPARAYSMSADRSTRWNHRHLVYQGVSVLAVKTAAYRSDLLRWDLDAAAVTPTTYPPPVR